MTYAQGQTTQQTEYEKVDRKVFTGRITKDLDLREVNGDSVLNIDFAMDVKALESGTQFAQISLWGEEARIANFLLRKGDNIVGSGVVHWREWTNQQGQSGRSLEYKYPTLNLDLKHIKTFIRQEIAAALSELKPQAQAPQPTQPQPQTPTPPAQPQAAPQQEEPLIDITDQDLPF